MVDIQQSREFIRKRERKDRGRNSGQATTSLPRVQIYMGKDEARMFCLGYHIGPKSGIKNGKVRGWVLHVPRVWESESHVYNIPALLVYSSIVHI